MNIFSIFSQNYYDRFTYAVPKDLLASFPIKKHQSDDRLLIPTCHERDVTQV
jgi:hypothetical protein